MSPDGADLDLDYFLGAWGVHLRAEGKSPATIKAYSDGVRRFLGWCAGSGHRPALTRPLVNGFVADMLDSGSEASTATSRQLAVRRLSAWLVAEGELEQDHLKDLRPPQLPKKVIEPHTDGGIKALLRACAGSDLRDRRDETCVRIMVETGLRAE